MTMGKPRVLLYGNCQGWWYAHLLKLQPEVTERFDVVYLANFGTWPMDHPIHDPGFVASCSVVIWQTAAGCKSPEFLNAVSTHCRQIRFPTLSLKILWPFHAKDPRNCPQEGFPYGPYSYGDRLLMRLMDQGIPAEDLPRRYVDTDISTIVDLERYAELAFAEMRINDRSSDIAVTPLIEETFRERRLFHTINHAAFPLLDAVYKQLESSLLERGIRDEVNLPPNAQDYFGDEQIPIHPQVIAHFRIKWATPSTKWRYHSSLLSMDEYILAYAALKPIPMGNPPELWLERARQCAAQGDLEEAKRILLGASATFPGLHHFLQFLAMLLVRAMRLNEAEQVLRYAISQHSKVAGLHYDLGSLMLRSNFVDEAARCFKEVLKIDPDHKGAAMSLLQTGAARRRQQVAAVR